MAAPLPRWDMTTVYPSLESAEYAAAFQLLEIQIGSLSELFDTANVGSQLPLSLDDATRAACEEALQYLDTVQSTLERLSTYIYAFVSTDSHNATALAQWSKVQQQQSRVADLMARFTAWLGSLDVDALIQRSPLAAAHAFVLRQAKIRAAHVLSSAEEALANELHVTGSSAWCTLANRFTAQITAPLEIAGQRQELSMTTLRHLAFQPERAVRRQAYEAELEGWQRAAVPMAAALNSIKGEAQMLARRRGWKSPLDLAVFDASIDQEILHALLSAATSSLPDFRRYLHAKARALTLPKLAWYDLFAPLGGSNKSWSFEEARDFILTQFGAYSDALQAYAARVFREGWIDAEPRAGKRAGGFCLSLGRGESRILTNYVPTYYSMQGLAHELGHGYHYLQLAQRTALQRTLPMTLAETASTFCQTLVKEAALQQAKPEEALQIVESALQHACQSVVDMLCRFQFEQHVFERRQERELAIEEFCALMLEAQRATYGEGLDAELLHPYMWAAKLHYYWDTISFYNFPYIFGLLFALGLYARYQADPEGFKPRYDEMLSSTGLVDAATLAARFGVDLRSPAFWQESVNLVRQDVGRFETLIARLKG